MNNIFHVYHQRSFCISCIILIIAIFTVLNFFKMARTKCIRKIILVESFAEFERRSYNLSTSSGSDIVYRAAGYRRR